ncbi:kinesin-like protein KIF14 [Coccinella septempunctata]|uniref:kinesin-like protein KIF14 n=1 Tax=Coccinella septempunctata TaxID=41139 RepID=UPI001D08F02D|nr:kinesin-like protein KIF14 [Coccinella septempunctata]
MSHTPKVPNSTRRANRINNNGFAAPSTPRTPLITPKIHPKNQPIIGTPECFSNVVFETPKSVKHKSRASQEIDNGNTDELRNLSVAVRVRPMNSRELAYIGATSVVTVEKNNLHVQSSPTGNSGVCLDHVFQYDHIFRPCDENDSVYSSQKEVFQVLGVPLLESAFKGYNACLFAYGQTGSGKSFSMMGRSDADIDSEEYSGIIPRFCRDLFDRINNLPDNCTATLDVSYFEIYNEKIHDLLLTSDSSNKIALKVREHPTFGPYVEDLSVNSVKTYNELRNWLLIGNKNRATAATSMNEKSSRSHSIFTIELCLTDGSDDSLCEGGSSRRSRVSLVDLAGSERLNNSHNNEERIRQGVSINKSLMTLGKVISSLADLRRNQFVPYRDSVLTWLLRESLGGNSMTTMLATITPSNFHVDETLATLRYACQARSIVNRARINENPHEKLIRELRSEVSRLRSLKKNFERSSLDSNISIQYNISNTSECEELEDLRKKLNETENKLSEAEKTWRRRFEENNAARLRELAEIEKRKEELESRMRIIKYSEKSVHLSPYKTNFLEELEDVLEDDRNIESTQNFETITDWCKMNSLNYSISRNALLIIDYKNNKQTIVTSADLGCLGKYKDVGDFLNNLTWNVNKSSKKLTKANITKSMNALYKILSDVQPPEEDEDLSILYAKMSKAIQKYETALINGVVERREPKNVTFNM